MPGQEPPKKTKVEHSDGKVTLTEFWDWIGPLLIRYQPRVQQLIMGVEAG